MLLACSLLLLLLVVCPLLTSNLRAANMEYTPLSFIPKKGCIMNNASAEIASAAVIGDKIRLFTVNPYGCPSATPRCEPPDVLTWRRTSTASTDGPTICTCGASRCFSLVRQASDWLHSFVSPCTCTSE